MGFKRMMGFVLSLDHQCKLAPEFRPLCRVCGGHLIPTNLKYIIAIKYKSTLEMISLKLVQGEIL